MVEAVATSSQEPDKLSVRRHELLPLKDTCVGLVWSNLALQWCNDMNHTFSEVRRVLQPAGCSCSALSDRIP